MGGLPLGAVAAVVWLCSRRLPRCPANRIGFVVAFSCDDTAIQKQFQSDFCDQIRLLLSNGAAAKTFWFKDLSDRPGLQVTTTQDAEKLRNRTGASFVLFGTVRSRGKKKLRKHYVDIRGMVWHGAIAEQNQKLLAQEFSELMPRRVEVPDDGSLPAFEFTSQLCGLAAEYLLAVALECAGALNEAEHLLDDLEPKVANANVQRGLRIAERIPTRRMEICVARANKLYREWRKSYDVALLIGINDILNQVPTSQRGHVHCKGLRAIIQVALDDDLVAAEKTVVSYGSGDPVSQMNLAFIKACRGDLRGAARHYRNAKPLLMDLVLVEEIMDFIDWYRSRNDFIFSELSYCLGFISFEIIEDDELAKKYFMDFLANSATKYEREVILVRKWLRLNGEQITAEKDV